MAKERTGYWFKDKEGHWWAQVSYTDGSGKRKRLTKRAENVTDARRKAGELARSVELKGTAHFDAAKMTYGQLADFYQDRYMVAAEYRGETKISGQRAFYNARKLLAPSREYFLTKKIQSITHADLEDYKAARLATTTMHHKPRSIAAVNRELSIMRTVLRFALNEGWLPRNPFDRGKPLINVADEKHRDRILGRDEEERLLAACTGKRTHLRPLLVCALDTGMRRGEMLTLTWANVNFATNLITVQAFHTKTARERQVAMTDRLRAELEVLYARDTPSPDALVFGITHNVNRAFRSACEAAGVEGFHFHDARHTAATRLIEAGMPIHQVARLLGHTQISTTYRYVNKDEKTVHEAAALLNRQQGEKSEERIN